jgi:hypothetical protein
VFGKYALQFHIFAIFLGIVGGVLLGYSDGAGSEGRIGVSKRIGYWILIGVLVFVFVLRVVPYLNNDVPLGYDAGIYRYGISVGLENLDRWILSGGMEPGFLYLMFPLVKMFGVDILLKWGFILACVLLGLAVWVFVRESFGNEEAIIALVFYAVSVVQYFVFELMYYKNVVGLCVMLFALLFLTKYERETGGGGIRHLVGFVLLAGVLAGIHRPTFYIFGLSYFVYAFASPWKNKNYDFGRMKANVVAGAFIVLIGAMFYVGEFRDAVIGILPWVVQGFVSPGESPGTFISFFSYQFAILACLPFAILGLVYCLRKREFNFVVIWALINLAIVYFQFFFFNRFIIHLDIAMIILASLGVSLMIREKRKAALILAVVMIAASGVMIVNETRNVGPLLSAERLDAMKVIGNYVEENASVIVISSQYSPWVMGYSGLGGDKIIAPGLFDGNKWSESEWNEFWSNDDQEKVRELMSEYSGEIYLYAGNKNFQNGCFSLVYEINGEKLYKYGC